MILFFLENRPAGFILFRLQFPVSSDAGETGYSGPRTWTENKYYQQKIRKKQICRDLLK